MKQLLRHSAMIFAAVAGSLSGSAARAQESLDIYLIPAQYVDCIISKQNDYLSRGQVLVRIYPALCPTVAPSATQIAEQAQNSGVKVNPASQTIVVPGRLAKCFFRKLVSARRANPNGTAAIKIDVGVCG